MDSVILVLIVFIASTALLLTNRIRYDLVGIGTVVVIIAAGLVTPTLAMAEFASLPVFLLGMVMVISKTISDSGVMEKFGEILSRRFKNEYVMLAILFLIIGLMSGFMSDVALTLMMIPIAYILSEKLKKSPTKYLIPFAFIAVLGGRFTVASTSSNLILYDLWYQKYHTYLPYFTFSIPGLIIVIVAIPVIIGISILLPNRIKPVSDIEDFKTGEYLTEAKVMEGSEVEGKTIGEFESQYNVRVVGVYPGRISKKNRVLRKDDVMIVRVKPEIVTIISGIKGLKIAPTEANIDESSVTEVFIMPDSRLIGTPISNVKSAARLDIAVLGISAYGKKIVGRLRTITVQSGDVLMISGKDEDIAEFITQESLAPLHKREIKILNWKRGIVAIIALAFAVALSSAGVNLAYAYLLAIVIILATRSLNFKEIYHSIEWPILVFVGTYLVFGSVIVSSGLSTYISTITAGSVVILFLLALLFANVVGNVASAVIMGEIALSFPDPLKALTVVAMAASCTFITPFGNQSNLLVKSPGGYTTKDYAIYGSIVVALVFLITMIYAL